MALGEFSMFSWKSRESRDREQKEYSRWAFPHGPEQRVNLEALLRELRPKERKEFVMMGFLTSKELYERYLADLGSREEALDYMINVEKKYKQIVSRDDMTTFLAVVLADAEVDESCEYPSVDEINQSIQELDKFDKRRL